jgi:hypothetical protein
MLGPVHCTPDSPQFIKDAIDHSNKAFMEANGLDHLPATWNADSRDGSIKGCENNCVLIALSDSGALNTEFWLQEVADAPGSTLEQFATEHRKGNFLVCFAYPAKPDMYPPMLGNEHYSAFVDGVLCNASNSAPKSKVNYAFEVLHGSDIEERGINLKEQLIFPKP